jgi:hypothetical protein
MATARTALLVRGRRLARTLRPATLIYAGTEIPCVPGHLGFFERLRADGGGFTSFQNQHVTVLRQDVSPAVQFQRGEPVQVRDEETGDVFDLFIGENNSTTAAAFLLNLQSSQA